MGHMGNIQCPSVKTHSCYAMFEFKEYQTWGTLFIEWNFGARVEAGGGISVIKWKLPDDNSK